MAKRKPEKKASPAGIFERIAEARAAGLPSLPSAEPEGGPYCVPGRALWSFSGGRTSAFMLWMALQAHGGKLPADHVVTFANTGLEDERTLRFVYECASRWGVEIYWLEWRPRASDVMPESINGTDLGRWWGEAVARCGEAGFEEVGFNSASRNGEPFMALVAWRQYTPNRVSRFCTQELKIRVMRDFCMGLGWDRWANIVGLRYDEGRRILKALARNAENKERFKAVMPMAAKSAKVTKRDVLAFWLGENEDPIDLKYALPQGFDLGLRDYEGNCRLCFLKGYKKKLTLIRERPADAHLMSRMEMLGKGNFHADYSFADLLAYSKSAPLLPGIVDEAWEDEGDAEHDAECGLWC